MENLETFTDEFGIEFTIKKEKIVDYDIHTYLENGKEKFKKVFDNGVFSYVAYFAYSKEDLENIIEKYKTVKIEYIHFVNSYKVVEYITYRNKVLEERNISVIDSNNNNICFRKHEIENGKEISFWNEKNYYENGEMKYLFDYNKDGTCFIVNDYESLSDIYPHNIGTEKTNFTWIGFEYYQFSEPLIPNEK
jgi:hypothetical protein